MVTPELTIDELGCLAQHPLNLAAVIFGKPVALLSRQEVAVAKFVKTAVPSGMSEEKILEIVARMPRPKKAEFRPGTGFNFPAGGVTFMHTMTDKQGYTEPLEGHVFGRIPTLDPSLYDKWKESNTLMKEVVEALRKAKAKQKIRIVDDLDNRDEIIKANRWNLRKDF